MFNWTDEAVRAENEYRRERLHNLATRGYRRTEARRQPAWLSWLHRGLRR